MKLILFCAAATALYGIGLACLLRERKRHPTQEERVALQSVPMILAASVFYVTVLSKTIFLSLTGVLPLL